MKLPGFTAEASLYKTSSHYQMLGTDSQSSEAIHPALWLCFPVCFGKFCYRKCHYIPDPIIDPWKIGPVPDPGYLTFEPDPSPLIGDFNLGSGVSSRGIVTG